MKAPDKIYVEVCEDGIFAFPEPPFEESIEYIRADLVSCPKLSDNSLDEEIAGMYQALFGTDVINRKERVYLDTFEAIARHFYGLGLKANSDER
jgi:hypothetical protein